MNINKYLRHFDSARFAMFLFAGYSILATIGIFELSGRLATIEETTRIIPYAPSGTMVISNNSANSSYYKSWGNYIAISLGNLTPGNVKFVEKQLLPLIASTDYQTVKTGIQSEVASEIGNHVVTTFTPSEIIWQGKTGTVFVYGRLDQISPNGKYASGSYETYQMQMKIVRGMPKVSSVQLYMGHPHTLTWMKYHMKGANS